MIYFTEHDIDQLIEDDAPSGDLTSWSLGLATKQASITWNAREELVVSCSEELQRLCNKLHLSVESRVPSGTFLKAGEAILTAHGRGDAVHMAWRAGLTLLEFASAIATRTRSLVTPATAINPRIKVAGTRKHPPYLKKVALKSLMAGGGVPHRTGLSDTLLVFREHVTLADPDANPASVIPVLKQNNPEKKVVAEAHTTEEALAIVQAGAHAVQLDKFSPTDFADCAQQCKAANPSAMVIAAGGVNASNAADYASAGADVLVTSWMYFGPPADVGVEILPI